MKTKKQLNAPTDSTNKVKMAKTLRVKSNANQPGSAGTSSIQSIEDESKVDREHDAGTSNMKSIKRKLSVVYQQDAGTFNKKPIKRKRNNYCNKVDETSTKSSSKDNASSTNSNGDEIPTSSSNDQNSSTSSPNHQNASTSDFSNENGSTSDSSSTDTYNSIISLTSFPVNLDYIRSMLNIEGHFVPNLDLLVSNANFGVEIRRKVLKWISEMCTTISCDESILLTAINFLDRFYEKTTEVSKDEMPLIGCICVLIAAEARRNNAVSYAKLRRMLSRLYSEDKITLGKQIVLHTLKSNVVTVVATDFIVAVLEILQPVLLEGDIYLKSLKATKNRNEHLLKTIKQHSNFLAETCASNIKFISLKPSVVAGSCVLAAFNKLLGFVSDAAGNDGKNIYKSKTDKRFHRYLVRKLRKTLKIKKRTLKYHVELVESILSKKLNQLDSSKF